MAPPRAILVVLVLLLAHRGAAFTISHVRSPRELRGRRLGEEGTQPQQLLTPGADASNELGRVEELERELDPSSRGKTVPAEMAQSVVSGGSDQVADGSSSPPSSSLTASTGRASCSSSSAAGPDAGQHSPACPWCEPGDCPGPMRTASGHCTHRFFEFVDEAYQRSNLWPGSVDLLLRTFIGKDLFDLQLLFHSIELFWPKNIGDTVVVLDDTPEHRVASSILPLQSRIKLFYEPNYLQLPGKAWFQWSYCWADNYTTADYVAIIDNDVIFVLKVVPSLIFNLTEGKPYVLGNEYSKQKGNRQEGLWQFAENFLVGPEYYWGNFMIQLPYVVPRPAFAGFRGHVEKRLNRTFDRAFRFFMDQEDRNRFYMYQATMGNYMRSFQQDRVHVVAENSDHTPIPRVGAHMSYIGPMDELRKRRNEDLAQFQLGYAQKATEYMHEALCRAVPKGELPNCPEKHASDTDRVIWAYLYGWADWDRLFPTETPTGKVVLDNYAQELHCLYRVFLQQCGNGTSEAAFHESASCLKNYSVWS